MRSRSMESGVVVLQMFSDMYGHLHGVDIWKFLALFLPEAYVTYHLSLLP